MVQQISISGACAFDLSLSNFPVKPYLDTLGTSLSISATKVSTLMDIKLREPFLIGAGASTSGKTPPLARLCLFRAFEDGL